MGEREFRNLIISRLKQANLRELKIIFHFVEGLLS